MKLTKKVRLGLEGITFSWTLFQLARTDIVNHPEQTFGTLLFVIFAGILLVLEIADD
jgi:hypothetical protein